MSLAALGLHNGLIFIHNGRNIRLDKHLGAWALQLVDVETGKDYYVAGPGDIGQIRPTVDWLFSEKEAGTLIDPAEGADHFARRRTLLGLDKYACIKRDWKSAWRHRWAWAVITNGPKSISDESYSRWIKSRLDLINDADGNPERLPISSTLRAWERKLLLADGLPGVLVSNTGRLNGQSPLPLLEDELVHEASIFAYGSEDAKIVDAGAYYIHARDQITDGDNEALKSQLAAEPVRLETIRQRIRKIEFSKPIKSKHGKRKSRRMFKSAGAGVPCERFLERVEMDGYELKQIVTFSHDWPVPAGKMKMINAICGASQFWFLPSIFCGPYREDMADTALLKIMTPSQELPEGFVDEHPWLLEAYGTPSLIAPDNEKAIFSPGSISSLSGLGIDIELPERYHPDSKPLVEALNGFLTSWFEGTPGTIRGPRHPKDPTRNAIAEAEWTRAQLRHSVLLAWKYWNTTERDHLGYRSPLDLVQASLTADA